MVSALPPFPLLFSSFFFFRISVRLLYSSQFSKTRRMLRPTKQNIKTHPYQRETIDLEGGGGGNRKERKNKKLGWQSEKAGRDSSSTILPLSGWRMGKGRRGAERGFCCTHGVKIIYKLRFNNAMN